MRLWNEWRVIDYGFSMVRLDNGQTVAILVDEESLAYELGIRNGTVITKWNGEDTTTAQDTEECVYLNWGSTVKENDYSVKAMFLAGKGGDEITVTYVNATGNEETVNLNSIGNYAVRLNKALAKFWLQRVNAYESEDNFSCKMVTEDVGLLTIFSEYYYDGTLLADMVSQINGEYPAVSEMLEERLDNLKDQGMKKLIIDLRNNGGGMASIANSVVSIFSKYATGWTIGENVDGKYTAIADCYIDGKEKYSDIPIVVLVNYQAVSAGDVIAYGISKNSNVTLMGITTTTNSAQLAGGCCITTDCDLELYYPYFLTLDTDLQPMIDSDASREATIKLDEKIPLTMESIDIIWGDSDVDYELQYAIDYLSK